MPTASPQRVGAHPQPAHPGRRHGRTASFRAPVPDDFEITSQSHGDSFENAVKGDDWYRGATNHKRDRNASFDIEGRFDTRARLPTQVKVSGTNVFPLADARRWWLIDEPFRKILGHWVQDRHVKLVWGVTEFIVHGRMMEMMRGRTSHAEVSDCHDAILALREAFKLNGAFDAVDRRRVDRRLAAMQARTPCLTFNPKIDETNFRLQVSVKLQALGRISAAENRYRFGGVEHRNRELYTGNYGRRIALPHPITSGRRTFRDGSGGGEAPPYRPDPNLFDDSWLSASALHANADAWSDAPFADVDATTTPDMPDWGPGTLFG